jgi:hypothetical protein
LIWLCGTIRNLIVVLSLPDGVEIEIPIEYLEVNDGLFVPALNLPATRTVLNRIARKLEMQVKIINTIEDGYLGLMVWRVK